MNSEIRGQISDWLTGEDTCFLFGAGCSICADKPTIRELTEHVLNDADESMITHFKNLQSGTDRSATVEDLITYLVRYQEILKTLLDSSGHGISAEQISKYLEVIKKKIVAKIRDEWRPSSYHKRFLQRLCDMPQRRPRDIFSLNYDTLLEASLDESRIPYTDGFRGTNRAWFDPYIFKESGTQCRLFKLHGSINWVYDEEDQVRRNSSVNQNGEPVVIYPSEQKSEQIQYGVYEILINEFRDRLRRQSVNNCLIVLGYSFNDNHINKAIFDAMMSQGSNLTVIAFVGQEEKDISRQKERFTKFFERCDSRFNAFIGGPRGCFVGKAFDKESAQIILEAELWQFEKLTTFIAGDES